LDAMRYMP